MHQVGVVLAGKDVAGAAHVGGKLIDLVEAAVDNCPTKALIPQVAHYEIIGFRLREFMKFQVQPAYPEPVALQSSDKMAADEPAGPAH